MATLPISGRPLARAASRWLVLIAMILPVFPAQADMPLQLERVVLLYRHGVRTPLPGEIQLDEVSGKPWPTWRQAPSELTPHGAAGARLMGQYDRQRLAAAGLFSVHGCPTPSQLSFWANTDQRTIASAQALAQGFAPGCPIQVGHLPQGSEDPLFHPMEAGATAWNAHDAVTSILASTGEPDALTEPHADALQFMMTVMGCDQRHHPDWCEPSHWHGTLAAPTSSERMTLSGPIATTSGTAESILMAYAEGFPNRAVGWGRIKPGQLESLSQLHALLFDLYARPDYMAERTASVLSHRILGVLQDEQAPRLNVFVGSDNNIVALASVLHLHFKMPSYAQDDPPIGGALGIELWREPGGSQRYVRVFYQAQSLPQLRALSHSPPATVSLLPPACVSNKNGLCRFADILPLLQRAEARAR
ncbi:histidine-type phosphatase [Dyella choica]|uniref:Histidine-type phosphatase n=1 Tax=Dyella choica TaxID=1927959 RepID=A0A3S0PR44_9GAMM|nr:histidine-type phosphatase [Dyella choica]RUL79011.1 histidine-type phosphatase [Dyella choica]